MSERDQKIPPGYRKNDIGIIPEDWEVKRLGEICFPSNKRINPKTSEVNYKCIELENITPETGRLIGYSYLRDSKSEKTLFLKGSVLFGKLRPYLRKYFLPNFEGVCSTEVWVLIPKDNIESGYLYYLVQTDRIISSANQSIGTKMPRAEWNIVGSTYVPLPPLSEQRAIARVLSDFDRLIESLDRLIEKKKLIKKGAMQLLLTGKKRLPGFKGEWVRKRLGEVLKYEQPAKYIVKNTDYLETGFVPVLTPGKTFILGYTDEKEGIYRDVPVIIFDDFTTASKYVDFPFKVKSSAMKILNLKDENNDLKFIYEKMQL